MVLIKERFKGGNDMSTVRFDYSNALSFVGKHEVDQMQETVKTLHSVIP